MQGEPDWASKKIWPHNIVVGARRHNRGAWARGGPAWAERVMHSRHAGKAGNRGKLGKGSHWPRYFFSKIRKGKPPD